MKVRNYYLNVFDSTSWGGLSQQIKHLLLCIYAINRGFKGHFVDEYPQKLNLLGFLQIFLRLLIGDNILYTNVDEKAN